MRLLLKCFVAAVLMLAASCVKEEPQSGATLGIGDSLPHFTVTDSHGNEVSDLSLRGCWAVITFFNTECADCRRELPELQSYYDQYAPRGVRFICIAREESQHDIEAWWSANNLTMPYAPCDDRSVYSLFARTGIPRTYISSPEGLICATTFTALPSLLPDALSGQKQPN